MTAKAGEAKLSPLFQPGNHDLFHEFQWMIDELHGGGDATVPRGLDAAIQEGYRPGVRI